MKYYKNPDTNDVYAYPADGTGDAYIKAGLLPISEAEALAITNPPPTLDALKETARLKIKQARDNHEQRGFEYLGKNFDSDPVSVARIQGVAQAAQIAVLGGAAEEFSVDWVCQDNSVITLDAAHMLGLVTALAEHAGKCHAKARSLREAVMVADSAEAIDAVLSDSWLANPETKETP